MAFPWTCPYCGRDTTITDTHYGTSFALTIPNSDGIRHFHADLVVCPNTQCRKFALKLKMSEYGPTGRGNSQEIGKTLKSWSLLPQSNARVLPTYVPNAIVDDYLEACAIWDLSPKASATLSRRCLQGMIRDFWGIKEKNLFAEIAALQGKTDPDTWAAIDAIRTIGNIGAHMEKDINVIVDVDPAEAQVLIELLELLVKDWYIVRHDRAERLKAIVEIKDAKDAAKGGTP
jgi:hypothetical protein